MKKQWEKRVEIFKFMYTCLIREIKPEDFVFFSFDEGYDFDAEWLKVVEYLAQNQTKIIEQIKPLLDKTWTWERLNIVYQALLLSSIAEANTLQTPRNVIINEALKTGKKYNIDNSYKFMNPILDKLIKKDA